MSNGLFEILQGDAGAILRSELVDRVVHSVVTSPPYYRKRKYGEDPQREIGWGTVEEYLGALCDIFDAVPLHPLGSVWVNLGDTRDSDGSLRDIPELFLQEMKRRGWRHADRVIWAKVEDNDDGTASGCCMTEPAPGRLNGNGFETLDRFIRKGAQVKKVSDAWTDTCAVRIPRQQAVPERERPTRYLPPELMSVETSVEGRNLHNVWRVAMGQTRRKHYAVYPPALVERPIAMTCPPRICSLCQNPWERQVESVEYDEGRGNLRLIGKYTSDEEEIDKKSGRMDVGRVYVARKPVTLGWYPTCECNGEVSTGLVLDPFMGSGTTGEVALKMGRRFVGIDLYEEHCTMARERCEEALAYLHSIGKDPFTVQYYR